MGALGSIPRTASPVARRIDERIASRREVVDGGKAIHRLLLASNNERVLLPPGEPENSINRRRADRANPLPVAALALPGECGEPHVAPGE